MQSELQSGKLHFWYDNADRNMITVCARGMNAKRIYFGFTPKEFPGCGFESTVVAAASQMLLERGSVQLALNANLGQPIARIYKRNEFYPIADRPNCVIQNVEHYWLCKKRLGFSAHCHTVANVKPLKRML